MYTDRSVFHHDSFRLADIFSPAIFEKETLEQLDAACRLRSYSSGQTVMEAKEVPDCIGWLETGFLCMHRTQSDGSKIAQGLLKAGDMFGWVEDRPPSFELEAVTCARIYWLERKVLEGLLSQSAGLSWAVLINILDGLVRARNWAMILANHRISGRLAGFLLFLSSPGASSGPMRQSEQIVSAIRIPIGRKQLADLLRTRPESISRAFHTLARAGLIEIITPNQIRILDIGMLGEHADEEDFLYNIKTSRHDGECAPCRAPNDV
ncbi:Crp/Fnr family transcriptional regulator [Aliiruegeria lutimaris]|uniref:Cyclic nucleotide-binding domain-containing protein n=1 Tax=Aliiruegeria lutimaris TaxID=571298 RepID=A0A1G8QSK1_9RHOB|nr:Crp/Fnr family transcriptional regulator [Aliiruegeria lutimaris]SDJ07704.1 Cyclic nucleotide-binding domain-containing protein [Aliiruegeria lutimaris]